MRLFKLFENETQLTKKEKLKNVNDTYILGKNVFESDQKMIYDSKTKLFKLHEDGFREDSYCSLKYLKEFSSQPYFLKYSEQYYLYEGLQTSFSITDAVKKLKRFENIGLISGIIIEDHWKRFNFNKTPQISFFIEQSIYDLRYSNDEVKKYIHELTTTIKLIGYFVARKTSSKERGDDGQIYDVLIFIIHPKYIIDKTDDVYSTDGILYHLTLKKNLKRIQEKGFIPRNLSEYGDDYPDRVYFFTQIPPDNFQSNVNNFAQYVKESYRKKLEKAQDDYKNGKISKRKYDYIISHRYEYRDWVILRVNIKDSRSYNPDDPTTMYKFFDDPRSIGIFTYENIDPQCISIEGELHLKGDKNDFEKFILK